MDMLAAECGASSAERVAGSAIIMEQQMTAAISDLLRTMDWAKVAAICKAVESNPTAGKRVRSTAGAKRPFAGAAGGPTGAPGQALQKRARS